MKIKPFIALLALVACVPVASIRVSGQSALPSPAATSDVSVQLQQLVAKIKAKIQAGARTEAALSEELAGFDTLLAAHQGEKTDAVAQVLVMKAMLYVQIIQNLDKGEALLKQLKTDFPQTKQAQNVDRIIAMIEQQKEAMKVQAMLKPGVVFPDFSEKDLAGAPLSVARFKGKIVLVDFWATWCGPCMREMPNVIAAYGKYHDKGFEIVGISLDQNEDALKKCIQDKNMAWPQYFDGKGWQNKLGQKYGINSIPASFLIDKEGKIVAANLRGPVLDAELAQLIGK